MPFATWKERNSNAMKKLDVFLTRKATATWSGACVFKEECPPEGELGPRIRFVLERPNEEPVDLGEKFGIARTALYLLRDAASEKA